MKSEELTKELFEMMEGVERFAVADVMNRYNPQTTGEKRTILLALHGAMEGMRQLRGVDFGPIKGFSGNYGRCEWDRTHARGRRQRSAAGRKANRALLKLELASRIAPDPKKEKLEREADRQRLRIALSRRHSEAAKMLVGWE
jgi:hypothetical protein